MKIWFDVEDLFVYAQSASRPSGIQRLSYEMYKELRALAGERVGFVGHDMLRGTLRIVEWAEIEALYARMTRGTVSRGAAAAAPSAPVPLIHGIVGRIPLMRAAAQRLPHDVRLPLGAAVRAQAEVFRSMARAARALPSLFAQDRHAPVDSLPGSVAQADAPAEPPPVASPRHRRNLLDVAKPGDILASFGSPWSLPDYAGLIASVRGQAGLRFAMLVYDLIPVIRPEFCDRGLVVVFSNFIRGCLPQADQVLAISDATVRDIVAWSEREGVSLRSTPRSIPIGTGFSHAAAAPTLPKGLEPGGYALFVSTIEARKNHIAAFRAWRLLLDHLPPDQVPTLVFAGRVGWMVADLMQQLQNARHLDGKLVIVEDPDDATLAALYRGARFTLFPSLYEGWGLPVSESLGFGKVCLASSSTSIPEAGGPFCLYHDPDSVTDATRLYRRAIEEPGLIESLEQRIAAEYRPTPWTSTARAILDELGVR